MKRFLIILIILFTQYNVFAQYNLVPNYSFEDSVFCPNVNYAPPPKPWYLASGYYPIYYNFCATDSFMSIPGSKGSGYQYPRTGNAIVALSYYYESQRHYLQIKLNDSLLQNKLYYAEYFVNAVNMCRWGINNIGMLFSTLAVYPDTSHSALTTVLFANPQVINYGNLAITDTLNWVKVSGIFKAKGGEKFLTLGNFDSDSHTQSVEVQPQGSSAYLTGTYFVDDILVIPLDSFNLQADAGRDTTITIGDSVFIGSLTNGIDTIQWQIQSTGIAIDSTRPGFWVKPLINTCYVLTQTVNGYTSSDTVCVTVKPLLLTITNYELRITNEKSIENKWTTANEVNVSHFNIQRSINGKDFMTIGKVRANNKNYNEYSFIDDNANEGINYYRIESIDNDGRKQYSTIQQITIKHQTPNGVAIYPNPAKDVVNISCAGMKEVTILNELGQVVQHLKTNNEQLKVDISNIAKGLYLLRIITQKNVIYNEKLIVQ